MADSTSREHIGILCVILSSICFAFVPNTAKMALDEGASLFFLLAARYAIGAILLVPVLIITGQKIAVQRTQIRPLVITSLFALFLLLATYHAVDFLDVGLVLLILYSFPIGVALISQFSGRERIPPARWLCMMAVLGGLGLMILDGIGDISFYGIFVTILGLICFVFFIETSSQLAKSLGSPTLNLHISLIGLGLLRAMLLLPIEVSFSYPDTPTGFAAILGNGTSYILSWVLFFEGARMIGATRASFLASVEPLFAALLAMMLLGQFLSPTEWIGFFIVLLSIFMFEKLAPKTG